MELRVVRALASSVAATVACGGNTVSEAPKDSGGAGADSSLLDSAAGTDGSVRDGTTAGDSGPRDSSPNDAKPGPIVVTTGLKEVVLMASDSMTLFLSDGTGLLESVPVLGGAATTLVPSQQQATLVSVDASFVYFTGPQGALGEIRRIPKTGGSSVPVSTGGNVLPGAAAVQDGTAYWSTPGPMRGLTYLESVPVEGGSLSVTEIQVLGPYPNSASVMAASAGTVFLGMAGAAGGAILVVPPDSGAPEAGLVVPEVLDQGRLGALVSDDVTAYAYQGDLPHPPPNPYSGTVTRIAVDGTSTTLATVSQAVLAPGAIATDSTYAYFLVGGQGVSRVPKQGGAATPVVSDPKAASVAVDATAIYWESGGTVRRIAK